MKPSPALEARAPESAPADHFAAVDLGSNSFHMLIARFVHQEPYVVDRLRERVRLAAGLDQDHRLSEEAQARALETLSRFGERLRDIPADHARSVGTNTLRLARNARSFLSRAVKTLGHRIEIISGQEEARLIYLGVAHSLADDAERRLVVDIGGGSTEYIVGERFEPIETASLYMGCVSYSLKFFPGGELSTENLRRAETAARLELETIENKFRTLGWDVTIGSSGTVHAIKEILRQSGWSKRDITEKGLKKLRKALIQAGSTSKLSLPGLNPDRIPVLPGGLAILCASFRSLHLEEMKVSNGALREGVLYDLIGRRRHEDIRDRTIQAVAQRYHVDPAQAARVEATCNYCLKPVAADWGLESPEFRQLLGWAARIHEIGLTLSYSGYHKHGAYIVANSELAGFSRDDQQVLAVLVQAHRRKIDPTLFQNLPQPDAERALRLGVLLRLAVLLNRRRSPRPLPRFLLKAGKNRLEVIFPAGWLAGHPLTRADLEEEAGLLKKVGVELQVS